MHFVCEKPTFLTYLSTELNYTPTYTEQKKFSQLRFEFIYFYTESD